ncbi:MAG: lipoyl(octanoyl) transferase LipB [Roseitalea sp.]|nr:lipoyl(octanoyl) transferase LipB [Roseitalea sp.]MBO6950599.1 lipoyl(octanoyl) transferase LipB [Rhizobiaceae bacterium]MBO6591414.1 lipoyl(octanoyl) transferase LipB [Roseitalea sp.]MBO6599269.1 lipoyl(octanoyl) transferase LipB [Roseitalea sp.]MBO6613383.1 lipoyl(octanoyl) transferase LipB [Roseitalea sp.]
MSDVSTMPSPPARDDLAGLFHAVPGSPPVEWRIADGLVDYEAALAFMEDRVAAIHAGIAPEMVWLIEHPPLYTAGTSADAADLTEPDRFPVFETGRGGQYTYHGPGQRVAYVMLDLKRRRQDVRAFVAALEAWVIGTLDRFNIKGERREDRVGVWVQRPERPSPVPGAIAEDKIAAIGIRLRKWVSFHGISINVEPDLSHYGGIVPCGVTEHGVTSLVDLGLPVSMADLDVALKAEFKTVFGPVN